MANNSAFFVRGDSIANSKIIGDKPFSPYALQDISHYSISSAVSVLNVVIRNGDTLTFQFESKMTLIQFKNILDNIC